MRQEFEARQATESSTPANVLKSVPTAASLERRMRSGTGQIRGEDHEQDQGGQEAKAICLSHIATKVTEEDEDNDKRYDPGNIIQINSIFNTIKEAWEEPKKDENENDFMESCPECPVRDCFTCLMPKRSNDWSKTPQMMGVSRSYPTSSSGFLVRELNPNFRGE